MPSPDVMVGTWKLVRQENFDEYLHAVGAGLITRSMSDPETWCTIIEKLGDDAYKMTIKSTVKQAQIVFRLDGREIEEVTGDGRRCRTVMAWDGDRGILTTKRIGLDGCKGGMLTREFKNNEMELYLQADDVIARRIYRRQTK